VLVHQRIARELMIELFLRRFPVDQRKVFAIVFEMATDAIPAVGILHLNLRMVTVFRCQPLSHFLMALQALEGWRASSELVAARALRGSA